jgi:hypothetical protein
VRCSDRQGRHKQIDTAVYLNGMPTAETYARAFAARGFASYSSTIFNFVP